MSDQEDYGLEDIQEEVEEEVKGTSKKDISRSTKSHRKKVKKDKKVKEFQLSEEDNILLEANINDLRNLVISSIEEKISELESKIDEINTKPDSDKKNKKPLIVKLGKI